MPDRWQALIDFIALSIAFYVVLRWAKQARAVRIALLIIGLQAGALLARDYDLVITSWVLTGAAFLAVAVLLVVFQPELRHALMRVDTILRAGWRPRSVLTPTYRAISDASFALAQARLGGLIVLVRRDSISELVQGGISLGADISRELLEAIFQKVSPLHDGAVIVSGNTAIRANAVLPFTQRSDVPGFYGTRHRAAMGLAERTDALVIAISEQRGTVTLMHDRAFRRLDRKDELAELLETLHSGPQLHFLDRVHRLVTSNLRFKFAAVALAAAVWGISVSTSRTTVRSVTVPVEFSGVPRGMNIVWQSAAVLEVQLRGNPIVMASVPITKMVARFDLHNAQPGLMVLSAGPYNLDLPPGILLEKATPRSISVRLQPVKK